MTTGARAPVRLAAGDVIDLRSLAAVAGEVAARQPAIETRRTYASVYRGFCVFLGPELAAHGAAALTPEAVRAYRDQLEAAGRSPATVAKHLSALRTLATALGADRAVHEVKSAAIGRGEPRALTHDEYERLLRMPDRRTRQGKRDLALLHLLGTAGLRRAEAARLAVPDVDERKRSSDPRLRQLIAGSTPWWVTVRGKRGRVRHVPLAHDALQALIAWVEVRPVCATDRLLVSLPRTGRDPAPLDPREVGRIVARHAAAAGLSPERQTPHVLRHTFCTHLAAAGASIEEIRELAGHADIRTTTIYTALHPDRLERAVTKADERRRGLGRLAA